MWSTTYVHRDIKPNNVIVHGDEVKFIDPGLAKSANDEAITRTGFVVGTPRYWAPEQQGIQSNYNWTFKTDLYPLGLLAIEMFLPEFRNQNGPNLKDMNLVFKNGRKKMILRSLSISFALLLIDFLLNEYIGELIQ